MKVATNFENKRHQTAIGTACLWIYLLWPISLGPNTEHCWWTHPKLTGNDFKSQPIMPRHLWSGVGMPSILRQSLRAITIVHLFSVGKPSEECFYTHHVKTRLPRTRRFNFSRKSLNFENMLTRVDLFLHVICIKPFFGPLANWK